MADKDGAAQTQAQVQIELVDYLPGDRSCYPVEIQGQLTWLILRTDMTERLASEVVEYMGIIVNRWSQNWDGPAGEPPQIN